MVEVGNSSVRELNWIINQNPKLMQHHDNVNFTMFSCWQWRCFWFNTHKKNLLEQPGQTRSPWVNTSLYGVHCKPKNYLVNINLHLKNEQEEDRLHSESPQTAVWGSVFKSYTFLRLKQCVSWANTCRIPKTNNIFYNIRSFFWFSLLSKVFNYIHLNT